MIFDRIKDQAKRQSDAVSIQTSSCKRTYGELVQGVERTACQLWKKALVEEGTIALYFFRNRADFITYFLAATSIGWKSVPIDPKLPMDKVKEILEESEPEILITDTDLGTVQSFWEGEVIFPHDELEVKEDIQLPEPFPESIFYLGYTSGTSGKPKGFLRTQHSWTESFNNTDHEYVVQPVDNIIIPGSLVHSLFLYGTIHALVNGATVSLMHTFSAEAVAQYTNPSAEKNILYVVPTMLESLLNETYDEWSEIGCIISSGAKWNRERRKLVEETFSHAECIEFYGASELSFVSILHHEDAKSKPDSVGRPFYGVEVSIKDDYFQEVGIGEVGTLYVKSDMVFRRYFNRPEETKMVFKEGWASVGDLARLDEDGFIYLVGRANQMIISGGLNIYPEEVEQVLQGNPSVEECAVIGVPDTYWGEKVVAFIKWRNGDEMDSDDLNRECRKLLPKYKCPKAYVSVDEFPYTVSRKIARNQLEKQFEGGGRYDE